MSRFATASTKVLVTMALIASAATNVDAQRTLPARGGGSGDRNLNGNRNTSGNRNISGNKNISGNNVNINSNRHATQLPAYGNRSRYNGSTHHHKHYYYHNGHRYYGYGYGYRHPIAAGIAIGAMAVTTAAVIGARYRALPPSCVTVIHAGGTYYHCGSAWYQHSSHGGSTYYVAVAAPR